MLYVFFFLDLFFCFFVCLFGFYHGINHHEKSPFGRMCVFTFYRHQTKKSKNHEHLRDGHFCLTLPKLSSWKQKMMILILKELPFPGNKFWKPRELDFAHVHDESGDQLVCFRFLALAGCSNSCL